MVLEEVPDSTMLNNYGLTGFKIVAYDDYNTPTEVPDLIYWKSYCAYQNISAYVKFDVEDGGGHSSYQEWLQ